MDTQQAVQQIEILSVLIKSASGLIIPCIIFFYKKEKKKREEMLNIQISLKLLTTTIERIELKTNALQTQISSTQMKLAMLPRELIKNGFSTE